jgi:hypothetical protein
MEQERKVSHQFDTDNNKRLNTAETQSRAGMARERNRFVDSAADGSGRTVLVSESVRRKPGTQGWRPRM